ncbi:RPAP1-like protein [Massariosphaeria phaeospora]|uniref:RPAP1-like protein n=1 Tax=Massariosphaeria phaeospora TaxID=100035 RepID=A0A7C8MJX0_9PLEO|nr:RPAP1-like protein [Massariosphaeria phaeospora]
MSFARGERVHFDLDSAMDSSVPDHQEASPPRAAAAFVGDILERNGSTANPPSAPTFQNNASGFPAHKKRIPRVSAFKQQRAAQNDAAPTSREAPLPVRQNGSDSTEDDDRRRIDEENRQRLDGMSPEDIEAERSELFSNLSPLLIQKLLGRANLDDGSNEQRDLGFELVAPPPPGEPRPQEKPESSKKVSFAVEAPETPPAPPAAPPTETTTTHAPTDAAPEDLPPSIHFPAPPQPPDLDPSDPAFLEHLHAKYFPNLPYDPSSLSWMRPIDPSDTTSPYHPSHTALDASELRFNFKGGLLAPSAAREIPTMQGLHHHAEAPEAAGYTIPELARLSRSAVAAQRCMAYQTLGRILYRLGQGEFGVERTRQTTDGPVQVAKDPGQGGGEDDADVGSVMAIGLWSCMNEGRVVETLTEEANRSQGHLTAKTFAQEALWNWRRGGGRKRQAV